MQYGHMTMQDRRDANIDSNGSTPFQTHQSLGQALGSHAHLAPPSYPRPHPDPYRHPSTSPPTHNQPNSAQAHGGPPSAVHSMTFVTNPANGQTSPAMKRKQMDNQMNTVQISKRRRDDDDNFDIDGAGQGAKHWTDEEKTRLFRWLMGPNNDDHWNALRATKNSCLRECALEVFEGKKTYQALKGCYERNFNVFKQIYAVEAFHGHPGPYQTPNESDRTREYERRLQLARKASTDVGNVTARIIEHWFARGWYELFFRRWNGDPATTKPASLRGSTVAPTQNPPDDPEEEDPPPPPPAQSTTATIDFSAEPHPTLLPNGLPNGLAHDRQQTHSHPGQVNFLNPHAMSNPSNREVHQQQQHLAHPPPPPQPPQPLMSVGASPSLVPGPAQTPTMPPPPPHAHPSHPHHPQPQPPTNGNQGDTSAMSIPLTPNMVNTLMQYIQVQTQASRLKMEYLRRREEREEKEHKARYEAEQLRLERERFELEKLKTTGMSRLRTEKVFDLVSRTDIDPSLKKTASDYVRRLLQEEAAR
ncbi:histone acetyltransferase mst2 [Coprinopsis cinerea AmutBmut pab1-1]|nr:histone acetyltransferase mst2 [Coprinopsis cinerea AmutBmut pab1-1]